MMEDVVRCPRAGCSGTCLADDEYLARCPVCRHAFCPQCLRLYHRGTECKQAATADAGESEDEEEEEDDGDGKGESFADMVWHKCQWNWVLRWCVMRDAALGGGGVSSFAIWWMEEGQVEEIVDGLFVKTMRCTALGFGKRGCEGDLHVVVALEDNGAILWRIAHEPDPAKRRLLLERQLQLAGSNMADDLVAMKFRSQNFHRCPTCRLFVDVSVF
ncbi:unnamed protein product [Mesocestoides corti]|uniref:IBR domain-containing protein n=1 Tax=Mesocestoides corti TaxID=53468 RepID=A0A0R3UA92_MESCO|nr:unnamed protein product [Mesocestoides corti]